MAAPTNSEASTKVQVSKPGDPLEKEAERSADKVMRMEAPQPQPLQPRSQPGLPARPDQPTTGLVQRLGEGTPSVAADAMTEIRQASTGGHSLPSGLRSFMEPRLGADLSGVRVHTDESAASLANHLSARAFTYQNHVFFGRGQYEPGTAGGRHLLAHELTHTIQQGATVQRRAAHSTDQVQMAGEPVAVAGTSSTPVVQRLGLPSVLDFLADQAYYIPGFRLLTLVIGFNPINQHKEPRTAANLLRALIELLPAGRLVSQALDNHGVINKAAAWVEEKIGALVDLGGGIVAALKNLIDGLDLTDLANPGGVWERAKRIFTEPIGRLVSFGVQAAGELLNLVRGAILRPLALLAQNTAGYDLLKAVLGQDPITGEAVPPTADSLIGGFMKLIGQEEVWQNIKKGNAVARAFTWFQGALGGLLGFVRSVPPKVLETVRSLTFEDVVTVVGTFRKVGGAFLGLAARFGKWALAQVVSLLEILFSVLAPKASPYVAKAKGAFETIVRNPVGFVRNLVNAGKLGFQNFANNILTHLKNALIKWLVGPLGDAGVYIPQSFSLLEIVKLVLSVLGLTWQNIRSKLVKIIPDPVLAGLEKTASVLVTLVTDGPAAAWEQIKAELSELKDQLIGQVTQMITTEVVKAAVMKLVNMLNPAGAVVEAIVAIWRTVSFFIEKANQIGAVVASFIDSIAAIAAGQIGPAAERVEKTLARTLVVVVSFLANFVGLGGIPDKLVGIVKKIRQPIDKGLDKIVAWLGKMLDKLVAKAKETAKKLLEWWRAKVPIRGGERPHTLTFDGEAKAAKLVVRSEPKKPSTFVRGVAQSVGKEPEAEADIAATVASETVIGTLQKDLAKYDGTGKEGTGKEKAKVAAGGDDREKAGELSGQLNVALIGLAKIIGGALAKFGDGVDPDVPSFELERAGNFRNLRWIAEAYQMWRDQLPADHPEKAKDRILRDKGKASKVTKLVTGDTARRHIVSSDDMAKHYAAVLSRRKVSQAKLLLEQSGSVEYARVPVKSSNKSKLEILPEMIVVAAKERYARFFSYVPNLFLGDRDRNSKIGKHLDNEKPLMAKSEFENHVNMIKRQWALDGSFRPTPVKPE